jgi:hypothetical protein
MNSAAARLFEFARAEVQPPPGARERVLAAVLAAPPLAKPSGGGASAAVTSGKVGVAGIAVIALAIVGAFVATRHPKPTAALAPPTGNTPATALAPSGTPQSLAPPADSVPPANGGNAPDLRPATPKPDAPARPPSSAADALGDDVALLRDAQSALRGGDATRALTLLDRHAQRFPRSSFAQERIATQVQALCRLDRMSEASALFARLQRRDPGSPHIAALRRACPRLE